MTAEEKAKELVEKLMYCQRGFINPVAKQCALIAVDEILSVNDMMFSEYKLSFSAYWEEVKQEIEKL